MINASYRSIEHRHSVYVLRSLLIWLCAAIVACFIALRIPHDVGTIALLTWAVATGILALLKPRSGLYLLLAGTMLFEQNDPPGGVPLFNAQIPFFWDSGGFTSLNLPVTPAEMLLSSIIVGWCIHGLRSASGWGLRQNALLVPTLLFGMTLLLGTVHGLFTSGDVKEALWEIRGPSYAVIMVLLVPALFERRRHVFTVIWLIIVGLLFVGIEGLWIVAIDLNWNPTQVDTIVGHDDAAHVASGIVLLACMLVIGGQRWQKLVLLAGSPILMYVLFATRRRDAFVALGLGLVVLAAMRIREHPGEVIRYLIMTACVALAYGGLYLSLNGNVILDQPIRAVTSAISPSSRRDIASNRYREFERAGLRETIGSSAIIGVGFGQKYDVPPQVFDIGFPHYQYITHDDILRIWAKTGTVGFLAYWIFAGASIIQCTLVYRRVVDDRLKAISVFAICFVAMQLVISTVDMAMTLYRSMILFGTLIGITLAIERIDRKEARA